MRKTGTLGALSGALSAGLLMWAPSASADQLIQKVSVPVTLEHDSNPLMSATNAQSVIKQRLAPQYTLQRVAENDEINLSVGVLIQRADNKNLVADRNDPNISAGWRRSTPTGELGINAKYDESSARTTEFDENGLVAIDRTRKSQMLGGSWRDQLTTLVNYSVNASYTSITYDGGNTTALTDYNTLATVFSLGYALDERSEVFWTLNGSQFEPQGNIGSTSETYGTMLGYKQRISDQFDWSLQGGMVQITGTNSGSGWQGNGQLGYLGQRTNISLSAGRSVSGSGVTGGFASSDQVRGQISYALTERASAGFDATWIKRNGTFASTGQTYNAWVAREISQFWTLRLNAQRKQFEQTAGSTAEANIIGLSIIYSHPDL